MGHLRPDATSDSSHLLESSQQHSAHPPLYSSDDTTGFDVELEQEHQLPQYSTMFDVSHRAPRPQLAPAPMVHEFHINSGWMASKPWVRLRLSSRAASAGRAPGFLGGDLVSGFVDIMLENSGAQSVQAVTLTLRGRLIPRVSGNYAEEHTFLNKQVTVWPKPSSSSSTHPSVTKLEGNHSWPFSFPFPTQTDSPLREGRSGDSYQTPQTFLERGKNITVHYELVLKIAHGFLRPDSRISINVVYVPDITPPPMPEVRQISYRYGLVAPGPEMDPEGWHTLPSVLVRGHVLHKPVEITCVLSLAKPLAYTRGTFIPLHLSLVTTDTQALDVLAAPKAARIRLRRTITYFQYSKKVSGELKESDIIAEAQWWVPQDPTSQVPGKRAVLGELHLPRDMQSSCSFLLFTIEYTVEFIPFFSPVFQPAEEPDVPVASCPVKVGTLHAAGPLPRAITTPPPRTFVTCQHPP